MASMKKESNYLHHLVLELAENANILRYTLNFTQNNSKRTWLIIISMVSVRWCGVQFHIYICDLVTMSFVCVLHDTRLAHPLWKYHIRQWVLQHISINKFMIFTSVTLNNHHFACQHRDTLQYCEVHKIVTYHRLLCILQCPRRLLAGAKVFLWWWWWCIALRRKQNGQYFADDTFQKLFNILQMTLFDKKC